MYCQPEVRGTGPGEGLRAGMVRFEVGLDGGPETDDRAEIAATGEVREEGIGGALAAVAAQRAMSATVSLSRVP